MFKINTEKTMDFKKFASDAGTMFSRAKQYTEEKLGHAEKTELDAHFENLLQRAEKTRMWTERILKQTESTVQPNPNLRMEEYVYEKLDKKKRERMTALETLGQDMIDAGNEFGPSTSYGSALVKSGHTQQKLGQAERDYLSSTANNFLQPLKAFLDGDMKTVQKEKKILENKRLDLDAAKSKLRKAKMAPAKDQAEAELRNAQTEFDRQSEITKLLLEGISSTHAHHLRCLHDFIEAQSTYYAQCQQYMQDLQRQLGNISLGALSHPGDGIFSPPAVMATQYPPPSNATDSAAPSAPTLGAIHDESGSKARVLYDYESTDMKELSLEADEDARIFDN